MSGKKYDIIKMGKVKRHLTLLFKDHAVQPPG